MEIHFALHQIAPLLHLVTFNVFKNEMGKKKTKTKTQAHTNPRS